RVPMERCTSVTKVPPCSTACLLARLDEPQPCVDASRDACEEVSSVGVLKESSLLAGVAYMFAKGGKLRRKCIDVAFPIGRCQHTLIERRPPVHSLPRSRRHDTTLTH